MTDEWLNKILQKQNQTNLFKNIMFEYFSQKKKNLEKISYTRDINLKSWSLEPDCLGSNPGLPVTSSMNLGKVVWLS